jgi:hypothetical protein
MKLLNDPDKKNKKWGSFLQNQFFDIFPDIFYNFSILFFYKNYLFHI